MPQSPFDQLQAYCMFVGYGRSGTTLVRSLLDAHPNIIIASEVHALRAIKDEGIGRDELFERILQNSQDCATPGKWNIGYDYLVPDQWQGRFDPMLVIGDKEAAGTSNVVRRDARVLERLRKIVGLPIRAIFCHRNPFDQITTMCRRSGGDPSSEQSMGQAIGKFRKRCEGAALARQQLEPSERIDIWHESFVEDPQTNLAQLSSFLGVDCPQDWVEASAAIVFESPRRRRDEGNWTNVLKEEVNYINQKNEMLSRYHWDN